MTELQGDSTRWPLSRAAHTWAGFHLQLQFFSGIFRFSSWKRCMKDSFWGSFSICFPGLWRRLGCTTIVTSWLAPCLGGWRGSYPLLLLSWGDPEWWFWMNQPQGWIPAPEGVFGKSSPRIRKVLWWEGMLPRDKGDLCHFTKMIPSGFELWLLEAREKQF